VVQAYPVSRFLLAHLYTDSLRDKRTVKDVKLTLAKLSKGSTALNYVYKEALQRIEGQLSGDYKRAKKVLSWITYAQRPLTTAEICCALAVEPGEEELDPENVPDVEDLVSVCAGLVVIDYKSGIIRLVHYTAQEYFEHIWEQWNPSAQLEIASTCLAYLSFSAFKSGGCSTEKDFKSRLKQNVLLDYAARHWGQHAVTAQEGLCEQACKFLQHDELVSCAAQVTSASGYGFWNPNYKFLKKSTGLHLTAQFGLLHISEKLLLSLGGETAISANVEDGYDRTPLWFAAFHGHSEMVKLLLDKGANIQARGGGYGNALYAASREDQEQVAMLLIDRGADVNAHCGSDGNALNAASHKGHEQIVKLLLDRGADPNAEGSKYVEALREAFFRGNMQSLKQLGLLLDSDVNSNDRAEYYGYALRAALYRGHERVAMLLVDRGADFCTWSSALQEASYNGHEQLLKLLLDKGADVNAQGGEYGNALQAASYKGHKQIVKLLLDKGADVNAQGGKYGNALQAALARDHEQIVKLLLDKGADVNAQGGMYGNALQAASASYKGHKQIVKLLVDRGAI
jgi:ankyrin repeat protein